MNDGFILNLTDSQGESWGYYFVKGGNIQNDGPLIRVQVENIVRELRGLGDAGDVVKKLRARGHHIEALELDDIMLSVSIGD